MIIEAENMKTGIHTKWAIPSQIEATAYSIKTHGTSYDREERKNFTGGLPMVWEKMVWEKAE